MSQWAVGDAAGLDNNYIGMIERLTPSSAPASSPASRRETASDRLPG